MILLIHSWGGANETVKRHWPYFLNFGASRIVGVSTEIGDCVWPKGTDHVVSGNGKYMDGPNLPNRLMETIRIGGLLDDNEEWFVCCEYDTLCLDPKALSGIEQIKTDEPTVFCHRTGGQTFDAKVDWFSHNPWVWNKAAARVLVPEMQKILDEGHCGYGKAESSPDVFWAFACERAGVTVLFDFWKQFTRNSLDIPGDLEAARDAALNGAQVLHGVKTKEQLDYILT